MSDNVPKIIRSSRRSIALEIQSNGNLVVRAPRYISQSTIKKLLNDKQDWITEKQELIRGRQSRIQPKQYTHGEEFYYLGKEYRLDVEEGTTIPIAFDERFIVSSLYENKIKTLITLWYKYKAKRFISERVKQIADFNNISFNSIKLTSAKRRWASCTSRRNLNFSWRMIMLPPEVLDYIIVHELAHLNELNHSRKFWLEVEQMMPDYKIYKKWLKNNSFRFELM